MADDFQFIRETRKEKPLNRKRLFQHMFESHLCAAQAAYRAVFYAGGETADIIHGAGADTG